MATARDLVTDALRTIGAIATGETPSAAEASDALRLLQKLLGLWRLEHLLVYAETLTTTVLTASKQSYTVGSGGDIAITRPLEVTQAQLRVTGNDPDLDLPLRVLSDQEYGAIHLKAETSTYPRAVWLHPTYPLATLYLHPVPTEANTLVLWTRGVLQSISSLDTELSLPDGYEIALQYNLAVFLCTEYGRPVTPELAVVATETREIVKRGNVKPHLMTIDVPAGRRRGAFDWRTGE